MPSKQRCQVAGGRRGQLGVGGDLAGGVGDVHRLRGVAPSLPPKTPKPSRKSRGVPTTIARSHWLNEVERALVTSCGWPPGTMPRPMPLAMTGMPVSCTKWSAASSAPSAHTSVPRMSTGRVDCREQLGDRRHGVGIGLDPRRRVAGGRRAERGAVEELVQRDVDERGSAVRRPGQRERLVHGGGDVRDRVGGGGRLGDRLEDRRMVELLQGAAAPARGGRASADDHERRSGEARLRDRADAVRDAGAGGQHREAGGPGQLADGLGREHGRGLVPHVDDRHRRFGVHRSVVHREDVRAGEREHRRDAVRAGDVEGMDAAMCRGCLG